MTAKSSEEVDRTVALINSVHCTDYGAGLWVVSTLTTIKPPVVTSVNPLHELGDPKCNRVHWPKRKICPRPSHSLTWRINEVDGRQDVMTEADEERMTHQTKCTLKKQQLGKIKQNDSIKTPPDYIWLYRPSVLKWQHVCITSTTAAKITLYHFTRNVSGRTWISSDQVVR